jgi:hypothetical protein
MSAVASKGSRKWHPHQENLFEDHLFGLECRPIGGNGNGVMEREVEARWTPLLGRSLGGARARAAGHLRRLDSSIAMDSDTKTCKIVSPWARFVVMWVGTRSCVAPRMWTQIGTEHAQMCATVQVLVY